MKKTSFLRILQTGVARYTRDRLGWWEPRLFLRLLPFLLAGLAPGARANVIQANTTYPPPNGSYRSSGLSYDFGASLVQLKDVTFVFFDNYVQVAGAAVSPTFNAKMTYRVSTDGGTTFSGERMANASFAVALGAPTGSTYPFSISSLTISGGDLPGTWRLRKALALAGSPVVTFTLNGSLFTIDNTSFFMRMELSTDSGVNWTLNTVNGTYGTPGFVLTPLTNEELTQSPTLPAGDSQYYTAEQYHAKFASGIVIRNPIHSGFLGRGCSNEVLSLAAANFINPGTNDPLCPPPLLGQSQIEDFSSRMSFDIEMPAVTHVGPIVATVRTRVRHTRDSGVLQIFQTEMLQLTPANGSLPAGMNLRLNPDPNKKSLGITTLRQATETSTNIASAFLLRLQLTIDNGETWQDSDQFTRMNLRVLPPQTITNSVVAGYNLIAIQLDNTNNLINTVLPGLEGDLLYTWNTASQSFNDPDAYFDGIGWVNSSFEPSTTTLAPGEGALLYTSVARTFTVSGISHVPALPISIPLNRLALVSRQTNAVGTYENIVGVAPCVGSQFMRFNRATQSYLTNTFNGTTWSGGVPATSVGESVFIVATSMFPPAITCPANFVTNITSVVSVK